MATHVTPKDSNHFVDEYVTDSRLIDEARKAEALLKLLPQLKVWEIQYKGKGMANNCWYVGLCAKQDPFLLNFTFTPTDLNVEFRFSQYLREDIFEQLQWQNSSWRRASLNTLGPDRIRTFIEAYLAEIKVDFDAGRLKQGGKSFAETMIYQMLTSIFPGKDIRRNRRLDQMRSSKDKPLEFDLYSPEWHLAIEIQGPQHFEPIHGDNRRTQENDKAKKQWCASNSTQLIWMNWDGINKSLMQLTLAERKTHIQNLVTTFLTSGRPFMWWIDINTQRS